MCEHVWIGSSFENGVAYQVCDRCKHMWFEVKDKGFILEPRVVIGRIEEVK